MDKLDVRIVKLEPMRVASFWGFGASPEKAAWEKLFAWARPRGLLADLAKHRLFGFDNPSPSAGSPNYGYEVWIVVDPDAVPEGEARILNFGGGLYAVARCVVPKGRFDVIGTTWKKLIVWREDSRYKCGAQQCLEESLPLDLPNTEFVLDLYLPLAE
jgi:AraC family transcriptional regulator